MIDGAILLVELGLFLLLLLKVWRVHAKGEHENTGFFAYRAEKSAPLPVSKGPRRPGGPPHA